jgi:oligopeptide/dipeptide ABC transporter ATP-binding protein
VTAASGPASSVDRYPHEFSGGQRQRLGLARALIGGPSLIVADEPVSALDVSIQAQILNLMRDLQRQHGLTYLFISHDLSVVRYMADAIGVMYLGKLVETGPAEAVYSGAAHPYTQGLIDTVPVVDPSLERAKEHQGVAGELPSAIDPPSGCRFRTRCPASRNCAPPPSRPGAPSAAPPTRPRATARSASRRRAWYRSPSRPRRPRPDVGAPGGDEGLEAGALPSQASPVRQPHPPAPRAKSPGSATGPARRPDPRIFRVG